LDYQIYSNSVINIEKDFVLQTEVMSQQRLNQYGLQLLDTRTASDHFPIIADISFDPTTGVQYENNLFNYRLEQNYPNPFNPNTVIRYSISPGDAIQFVSLKVYDILGNEVATLVNEEKPTGSYEVKLNASTFSSGIYFYRLTVGNFSSVKKMIYLR
jgi:hypothetical protein